MTNTVLDERATNLIRRAEGWGYSVMRLDQKGAVWQAVVSDGTRIVVGGWRNTKEGAVNDALLYGFGLDLLRRL